MSLLGFQRALADLSAAPDLCRAAMANPAPVLQAYELTVRERSRLQVMIRDPLMATNCTLYRVNRVTPIYMYFPFTCQVLGSELRAQLDAFWRANPAKDLQYVPETAGFARFLKTQVERGALRNEFIGEIVDYESALMEVRFNPDAPKAQVRFSHHPARLLETLSGGGHPPADLERGNYCVEIASSNGELISKVLRNQQLPPLDLVS